MADGGEEPLAKAVDQTLCRRCVALHAATVSHRQVLLGSPSSSMKTPHEHLGACSTLACARNGTECDFSAPHAGQVNGSFADSTVVRVPHRFGIIVSCDAIAGDTCTSTTSAGSALHEHLEGAHAERRDRAHAAEVHDHLAVRVVQHRRRVEALVDLAGDGHVQRAVGRLAFVDLHHHQPPTVASRPPRRSVRPCRAPAPRGCCRRRARPRSPRSAVPARRLKMS